MTTAVAIDLQRIFAAGPWGAPRFGEIVGNARALVDALPAAVTRFVPPARPTGSWVPYYERWPFALEADAGYELVAEFADWAGRTLDAPTFGKWDAIRTALQPAPGDRFVVCGVSTDCCVIATVLAMADAGMTVSVATDACAAGSDDTHRAALEVLGQYAPQVQLVSTAQALAGAR